MKLDNALAVAKPERLCSWCGHPNKEHALATDIIAPAGCLHWTGKRWCQCRAVRGATRNMKRMDTR